MQNLENVGFCKPGREGIYNIYMMEELETVLAVGAGAGFALCYKLLPLQNVTVGSWIVHAIFYCVVIGSILLAISVLFFQNEMKFFAKYIKR